MIRVAGVYEFRVVGDGTARTIDVKLKALKAPNPLVEGQLPTGLGAVKSTGPIVKFVGVFTVTPQDNRVQLPNHQLVDGDQVRFALGSEPINELPAPLVEGTHYFVVGARINDFQVSLTQGGAVVVITNQGVGGTNEVWKQGDGSESVPAELISDDVVRLTFGSAIGASGVDVSMEMLFGRE